MGEMFRNHGRSREQVLDGNHGIERVVISEVASPAGKVVYASVAYLPWYYDEHKGHTYYYTRVNGWHRVEYDTWQEAFDHIARSRRMLTSKHTGSNYKLEAVAAGVDLSELRVTQAMLQIAELKNADGTFMSTVDGGYPVEYFDQENNVLCARCASAEPEGEVGAYTILYEGSDVCDECGDEIPPTQAHDVLTTSEQDDVTYGMLVSNVGWVRQNCPDYAEVKSLFDAYSTSKEYEQVTMWASNQPDPIEEAYSEEVVAELTADPWCHPQYDAMAESQAGWDL